jgi:hypothetical protein
MLPQLAPLPQHLPVSHKEPRQQQQWLVAGLPAAAVVQGLYPLPLRCTHI